MKSFRGVNYSARVLLAGAAIFCSGLASADWRNGLNVVFFPSDNKEKIVFKGTARDAEHNVSTDYAVYKVDVSNETTSPSTFTPAGYAPDGLYKMDQMNITAREPTGGTLIFKQVSRSDTGVACFPGVSCPSISVTITKGNCTSHTVGLKTQAGGFNVGKLFKEGPLRFIESLTGVVEGNYSKGWQTCTSSSTAHTCPGQKLWENGKLVPSETFAVIETRARYGYATLRAANGVVTETGGTKFEAMCRAAGGRYTYNESGWDTCAGDKVFFRQNAQWPLENSPSFRTCRTIKLNR